MLALPTLGISLLSDYAPQFSIDYHYSASLLPFLFFAMTIGLQRILRWSNGERLQGGVSRGLVLAVLVVTASGLGYYLLAPGPLAQRFDPRRYTMDAHTAVGYDFFRMIPADAVVVAQGEFMPHLSERKGFYGFPSGDYCLPEYLFGDTSRFKYSLFKEDWDKWLGTGHFEFVAQRDGYFLAKRDSPDQSLQIRFGDDVTLHSFTIAAVDPLRGGQPLCPIIRWRADRNARAVYRVQAWLMDSRGHVFADDERAFEPSDTQYVLRVPSTTPSGIYQISVSVYDPVSDDYLIAHDAAGRELGEQPIIASARIEKDKTSKTASQLLIENPYFVDMQEIRLLGYVSIPQYAIAGKTLPLGIYWRARGQPRSDYEVAVQLLDTNGCVAFEESSRPVAGAYPTTVWDVGEAVLDWHDLSLPNELSVGEYRMQVILRNAATRESIGSALVSTIMVGK
jgi:hypothetical protein